MHATAGKRVLHRKLNISAPRQMVISPRANGMLLQGSRGMQFWHVDNEHPEVSWASLWGEVWYEGYQKPTYVWQSSSASNDFEPKFSLTPLVFGTLKAAFYAMLFAIPLAIMGAIYTAYFMSPKMRQTVKPTIEIMEALPTVILGFLAGLWLAPAIEANLPGIFSLLVLLPLAIIAFAWLWHNLPRRIRHRVPDGWQAALVIPVIAVTAWVAIALSQPMEVWFFGGDMRHWLKDSLGLDFDQRNAMVVGFAMGFAVIPTIFSIAEDAIFSVPKSLSFGSLALGATPWQTLTRVVLLTASPGIFSAVMMGLGRAVGETMIVLMATGNTPVMDMNIFQGMRTLSANIAVEMPESEVASTHFRVLFLAAFVLFVFTFLFNTLAEIVRQRLRKKYSSL
jgi:phosphate transport system permease protein